MSPECSVREGLGDDRIVRLAGVVVGGLGVFHLCGGVGALFRLPALVYALAAPLGGALAGADRLVVDDDEDRVGVAGWEDAERDPGGALELHVKLDVLKFAVGRD